MHSNLRSLAAAGAAVFVFAAAGNATPLDPLDLPQGTTCSTADLSGSTACEGAYSGNASPDIPGREYFGLTGWTEFAKVDGDSGTDAPLVVTGGGTSGGWSLANFGGYETIMLALKGGNNFSVYLLGNAATAASSGSWNTDGILKGNGSPGPGLSNFTAWGTGTFNPPVEPPVEPPVGPPDPIPLPAAGWMLIAGLGGLAAMKRRRKASA